MPGRKDQPVGKYISKNFLRLDIGRVKVKINTKTEEVEQVIVETKIEVPEAVENQTSSMGVDALIEQRKRKTKKNSTNKLKNTN